MSFSTLHYQIPDLTGIAEFYRDILGMRELATPNGVSYGFTGNACKLNFETEDVAPYEAKSEDLYWKIGVTLRNLDHAVEWLKHCHWPVSEPRQFRDIGYMSHITDPNGFTIELLQQGFEGNADAAGDGHPIADQAALAHITLRVVDINAVNRYCKAVLGLNLVSVQSVSDLGFSLYFYSFETEMPPNPDLTSIENREWLWRRPYTILELQHLESRESMIRSSVDGQSDFLGVSINKVGEEDTLIPSNHLVFS
jgi:catechol-2,3-dioxygenase